MKTYARKSFPLDKARRYLEPGPVILISSAHKGERNIMTCGWHMMLGYEQVGCFIWDQNRSHDIIRKSRECVINVPTADMVRTVIDIGNHHARSGEKIDKFERFGLTGVPGKKVKAPLIAECPASFECRLIDASLVRRYSLFVFEIVAAHASASPKYPTTAHYRGEGVFMIAGRSVSYRGRFKRGRM